MLRALSLVCLLISWTVARQTSALCGRGQSCRTSKLEALSIGQCSRYEADDRPRPGPDVPDYVLKHAPLWRFHSQERAWPIRLDDYLEKVPRILGSDRKPVKGAPDRPTLDNLNDPSLNDRTVFLTSRGDITRFPKWIWNDEGKPVNGRSSAPAIIILVDHGDGVLDSFTFMFCAFNMGPYVREMGTNMGHHLSEWCVCCSCGALTHAGSTS